MELKTDGVVQSVREAREDGPEALAALAMSYGAAALGGVLRVGTLHRKLAEARDAMQAADEDIAALRHERDAALAELKAARESAADTAEVRHLREIVVALREDRARISAERDKAHEEFSLRLSGAEGLRERAEKAEAERDALRADAEHLRGVLAAVSEQRRAATQERDAAFNELDAATNGRDRARHELAAALARPTYEARTTAPTRAERQAHSNAGGAWLVSYLYDREEMRSEVLRGWEGALQDGTTYIALGADRLPCAWPVAAGEVTP